MNHVIEVLTGAKTEKITRWGHDRLTTYGIGTELSRSQWGSIGRELMRLGYVGLSSGEYATLELTESGMAILRARTPITLTKPIETPKSRRVTTRREGDIACDEILFERLRTLRKKLADERKSQPTSFSATTPSAPSPARIRNPSTPSKAFPGSARRNATNSARSSRPPSPTTSAPTPARASTSRPAGRCPVTDRSPFAARHTPESRSPALALARRRSG